MHSNQLSSVASALSVAYDNLQLSVLHPYLQDTPITHVSGYDGTGHPGFQFAPQKRFSGRAPYTGSKPLRAMERFASDMSIRTMLSSESNRAEARVRASSVLPRPVGPRKMKEPIGRRGSLMPERARKTASETRRTA